jgi:predicted kinase
VAEDNLRLGRTVIGDSVNPLHITRDAWRSVAQRAAVRAVEIEVICSDRGEHRRRIETRLADIPVTWDEVMMRNYEPWRSGNHISIDTAGQDIAQSFATLLRLLPEQSRN